MAPLITERSPNLCIDFTLGRRLIANLIGHARYLNTECFDDMEPLLPLSSSPLAPQMWTEAEGEDAKEGFSPLFFFFERFSSFQRNILVEESIHSMPKGAGDAYV